MSVAEATWRLFFDDDPFAKFDDGAIDEDLQGWGADHPIFATLIRALKPQTIVEVGTWKGASAINMARAADAQGLKPVIICIDTWLGTIESYSWRATRPELHSHLRMKNGWPQIYYQFLTNVKRNGFQERIVPLPQTSHIGLRLIKELKIEPELIYIDGSHEYSDVKSDLALAWECVADDGVIFGDDYLGWPGVTRAVDEFCYANNVIVMGGRDAAGVSKFAIAKSGNIFEILGAKGLVEPDGSCGGLKVCRPGISKVQAVSVRAAE